MKTMMGVALAVGLAGLGACATGGGASGAAGRHDPIRALISVDALMFTSFDADADMKISNAEIEAGLTAEFARADSNRDGSLQPIEFQNWSNATLGGGLTGPYRLDFDRNVDNVITAEEFRQELSARAREYDSDEDGAITRTEFVRVIGQARQPTQRRPESMPDGSQR